MPSKPSFKNALFRLLSEAIEQGIPILLSWNCIHCGQVHSGNLLRRAASIIDEGTNILSLHNKDGKPFAVIDISKNKKFKSTVADQYSQYGIAYVQVNPLGVDAESIKDVITRPSFISSCMNPRCKKCNGFQSLRSLVIIDASCWKCNGPMPIAVLDCNGYHQGPDLFSEEELILARQKGVVIQNNFSKTVGAAYLSNTCPHCGKLTGDHYLFSDFFSPAMNGEYPYEAFPTGYFCEQCYWSR